MRSTAEAKGFVTEIKDGACHLDGALDYAADFSSVLSMPAPLVLDLRELQQVNSAGIRRWLEFLTAWADQRLDLVACPPPFVSMMNSVPPACGKPGSTRVRSVLVPFTCETCSQYVEAEIALASVVVRGEEVSLPEVACESCGKETRLIADVDDYFMFHTWKTA